MLLSMASCSVGASNVKIVSLNSGRLKIGESRPLYSSGSWMVLKTPKYAAATRLLDDSEDSEPSSLTSQLVPNSSEVESLLTDICKTSIAEFELKLNGFRLYVARAVTGGHKPLPPLSPAPAPVYTNLEATDTNGSLSKPSLAISKALSSDGGPTLLDKAADAGLVILQSPRVGFFRRSRTIKGKRAPPACKEKQIVKEGQVVCYIEQLGGELPLESDVSGEVVKILREDGDPVGYGDALISILPSFPGIKKLQ
ncbi:hypothetical protein BT93_J2065 [Corymbia citriodora subsp. variegata]|nr:hypothetical protein BT93_J2065 [Corymbia citriodora subsp. variegata]